jgi:hypothetical protein
MKEIDELLKSTRNVLKHLKKCSKMSPMKLCGENLDFIFTRQTMGLLDFFVKIIVKGFKKSMENESRNSLHLKLIFLFLV